MIYKFLIKLLNECEYLTNYRINCQLLDTKEQSISIAPSGNTSVVKRYRDGGKIISEEFEMIFRLSQKSDSCDNYKILSDVENWLEKVKFSDYQTIITSDLIDQIPLKITVVKKSSLLGDDISTMRYITVCRFEYLEK